MWSAAARFAGFRLAQWLQSRKVAVVALSGSVIAQVALGIGGSAWHWAVAACLAVALAAIAWQPRRLRRRIELLQQGPVRLHDPG